MKKTFLRILPLAVAVLLATSCSKDDNNDNAVVNNGQETVQTKAYPISITVNQKGLSKLSCTGNMGDDLQPIFVPGDELAIYYKDGDLLKTLAVTEDNISNGGKTATFEGEIDANGLVDGVTELTAKIGTPITEAKTATSREDAVQKGCYQTATFTYSAEGNSIDLEEQNAYMEVVWENKGNSTVEFSINSKPVSLTLNAQGQGWIVAPAGVTLTCEALGITEAKTTEKANIYGINRTFKSITMNKTTASVAIGKTETLTATTVPDGETVTWASSDETVATVENGVVTPIKEGTTTIIATFGELTATCTVTVIPKDYVDLGVICNNQHIYFAESNLYDHKLWNELSQTEKDNMPKKAEWTALKEQCYWHWTGSGYNVFKVHDAADAGKGTYNNDTPNKTYNTDTDPYIFLSVTSGWGAGYYWSGEFAGVDSGVDYAFSLYFVETRVNPEPSNNVGNGWSVRFVRRSN